jgi:hypothetical protein
MHDQMLATSGSSSSSPTPPRDRDPRSMLQWDSVQAHFMSHTHEMIRTSLSVLPASVPISAALACFEVVLALTTAPLNSSRAAKHLAGALTKVVNVALRYPDLRDEVYLQVCVFVCVCLCLCLCLYVCGWVGG